MPLPFFGEGDSGVVVAFQTANLELQSVRKVLGHRVIFAAVSTRLLDDPRYDTVLSAP